MIHASKKVLCYLGECLGTTPQGQRVSGFQTWMQENEAWVRGRRFLGIPDICLPQPVPPYIDYSQELAAASPALYDMYVQDLLRLLSYGSSVTTNSDPYLDLFRWSDAAAGSPATGFRQQPLQTQADRRQQQQEGGGGGEVELLPHGDPQGRPDWTARLPPVVQWSHPALPWFTPTRGSGLVMAGGAALGMAVPGAAASDVDLFLVVPSLDPATGLQRSEQQRRDAAWLVAMEAMEAVQRQVAAHDQSLFVYAVAGEQCHTLDVLVTNREMDGTCDGTHLVAQLQLILRLYESPAQVRLHKYSKRLGLDILVPGLDPLLVEPAVRELDAMQSMVTDSFHHRTRIPTVRKLAALATGLNRLLLVGRLSELGVTPEEVKMVTSAYKGPRMTAADAAVYKGRSYRGAAVYTHDHTVACTDLGEQPFDDKDEEMWLQLKKITNFQVDAVHLQTGREALFSGSFTHTPFDDWYRCCLNKLEERLLRGEIDWEARARERVVQDYDVVALPCVDDVERELEIKCQLYTALLAALRAGRPAPAPAAPAAPAPAPAPAAAPATAPATASGGGGTNAAAASGGGPSDPRARCPGGASSTAAEGGNGDGGSPGPSGRAALLRPYRGAAVPGSALSTVVATEVEGPMMATEAATEAARLRYWSVAVAV
ncbi:hypothetical protein VOLCADRAFT_86019 [Volvox carteri f. nagariensis]|uniref:Uncharacterized protein n=1 Tax=Volvox carteri f. nagariensis TaxID=3068 RepID=D8THM1_VOLCA|nr:uncharacterized protein VOLCADRAFT_86019 [Volvox carteri f. nagariensis]EFJ52736.1 hypothetical protein VOLCADRAFT_86019 [Volvox carteri f. nagariensis]|eukprot:XP_002945741.1 hypothetical protein VOLCADRAFT_86019 [Volvox carteri f. nagariensis]